MRTLEILMPKLTPTQFATLQWIESIGGTCVAFRDKVVNPHFKIPGNELRMPAVSALHLVQRGYIEARDGLLHITESGKRALTP
jgi:hypothetical protein